jgi:putative oxygen-independent coproporphyrinogen III oxidase
MISNIPLSLYIHIPWCIQKCPYCDFNSHALKGDLPETAYLQALAADLKQDLATFPLQDRTIHSIFIGGGTPSLFSADAIAELLAIVGKQINIAPEAEITLEANPGTIEQGSFSGFKQAGINRLSIGIQSFQTEKLKTLGRIHNAEEAIRAVETVHQAGFDNFNLDLMHGLPNQTAEDALYDLKTALALRPTHLSWYQLTLEPNTAFYQRPPILPVDEQLADIQQAGQSYLAEHGFHPYEISAYTTHTQPDRRSQHNLNYWLFGDYLAIGAGAHGKITDSKNNTITRYWKTRHPKDYLNPQTSFLADKKIISTAEIPFEFMMNALRLYQQIPISLFQTRTGFSIENITPALTAAKKKGLLAWDEKHIETTELGKRYLNDLLQIFL